MVPALTSGHIPTVASMVNTPHARLFGLSLENASATEGLC